MSAPARALLSDLPKGHRFSRASVHLTAHTIERYLAAVEDGNDVYADVGLAPFLAAAALALGALLDELELPAASLHTSQEIAATGGVPIGATCALAGRIAQRSERGGMVISVIEFELTPEGAPEPALAGRATVMMPGAAS